MNHQREFVYKLEIDYAKVNDYEINFDLSPHPFEINFDLSLHPFEINFDLSLHPFGFSLHVFPSDLSPHGLLPDL
jgi:hypothetical protein